MALTRRLILVSGVSLLFTACTQDMPNWEKWCSSLATRICLPGLFEVKAAMTAAYFDKVLVLEPTPSAGCPDFFKGMPSPSFVIGGSIQEAKSDMPSSVPAGCDALALKEINLTLDRTKGADMEDFAVWISRFRGPAGAYRLVGPTATL